MRSIGDARPAWQRVEEKFRLLLTSREREDDGTLRNSVVHLLAKPIFIPFSKLDELHKLHISLTISWDWNRVGANILGWVGSDRTTNKPSIYLLPLLLLLPQHNHISSSPVSVSYGGTHSLTHPLAETEAH